MKMPAITLAIAASLMLGCEEPHVVEQPDDSNNF